MIEPSWFIDDRVNVLFPIETFSRELDYRLLLGHALMRDDTRIFIGSESAFARLIQLGLMRGGVYVGKLFDPLYTQNRGRYELFKAAGFDLLHYDEEGAVYPGGPSDWEAHLKLRLDPGMLDSRDHVCTWGQFQEDVYRNIAPSGVHVSTTGHPRFDLYKERYRGYYEEDVIALREEFGDFVLVNSNTALANPASGRMDHYFSGQMFMRDLDKYKLLVSRWSDSIHQLSSFVVLVCELALRMPSRTIVIRPHPSEDQRFFKAVFRLLPNVHVVYRGAVGPWLGAAQAVIHDGCTTAIEGYLYDRPVINYRAGASDDSNHFLPNIFGSRAETIDGCVELLDEVFAGRHERFKDDMAQTLARHPQASALLHNLDHDAVELTRPLFDALVDAVPSQRRRSPRGTVLTALEQGRSNIYDLKRKRMEQRTGITHESTQKFTGFYPEEIARRVEAMRRCCGSAPLQLRVHSRQLISLSRG